MKGNHKRFLALLMAFALILQYSFSASFLSVYAEGEGNPAETVQQESSASEAKAAKAEPEPEPEPAPAPAETKAPEPAPEPEPAPAPEPASSGDSQAAAETPAPEAASEDEAPAEKADAAESEGSESSDAVTEEDPAADAEEEAEEEEEEEDKYPAKTFKGSAGGVSVVVDAPEGAFPEGTTMKVSGTDTASIADAARAKFDAAVAEVKAANISFYYKGEEIQPAVAVDVRLTAKGISNKDDTRAVHVTDSGRMEVVAGNNAFSNGSVEFDTKSFSDYAVIVLTTFYVTSDVSEFVMVDGSAQVSAVIRPEATSGSTIEWTIVSDKTTAAGAAVTNDGVVTATGDGTIVVQGRLTSYNGQDINEDYETYIDTVEIGVTQKLVTDVSVAVNYTDAEHSSSTAYDATKKSSYIISGSSGTTANAVATVTPDDAADKSVVWSSSHEGIATVDQNGRITILPNAEGTVVITAFNEISGVSGSIQLRILKQAPNHANANLYQTNRYISSTTVVVPKTDDSSSSGVSADSLFENSVTSDGNTFSFTGTVYYNNQNTTQQQNWANMQTWDAVTAVRCYDNQLQYRTASKGWTNFGRNGTLYPIYAASTEGAEDTLDMSISVSDWGYKTGENLQHDNKTIQLSMVNTLTDDVIMDPAGAEQKDRNGHGVIRFDNNQTNKLGGIAINSDDSDYVIKEYRVYLNTGNRTGTGLPFTLNQVRNYYNSGSPVDVISGSDTASVQFGRYTDEHYLVLAVAEPKEINVTYEKGIIADVTNMPDPDSYTVQVISNEGGTVVRTVITVASEVPESEGKVFIGWTYKGRLYKAGDTLPAAKSDMVFTAKWIDDSQLIKYAADTGGTVSRLAEQIKDNMFGSFATPDEGYHFVKWVDEAGNTVCSSQKYVPLRSEVTAGATYTAKFEKDPTVKVTVVNGKHSTGETEKTYNVVYNGTQIIEYAPDSAGYELVSIEVKQNGNTETYTAYPVNGSIGDTGLVFSKDDEGVESGIISNVNADVEVTITYSPKKYKVTFIDEDGTTLKPATEYDYGTKASDIVKPADPTKPATAEYTYTFAGWTPEIADVTEDATYRATYTATRNKYEVTFVDEDGTTILKAATEYEYGTKAADIEKPEDPTKPEDAGHTYTFAGWTPTIADVTADATYKATYTATAKTFKVEFAYTESGVQGHGILADDKGKTSQYFSYGAVPYGDPTPSVTATAYEGYEFAGWIKKSTGDTVQTPDATVTQDETYTATWTPKTDTKYKVNWYYQTPGSEEYVLKKTEERTGTTGTEVQLTDADMQPEDQYTSGYTYDVNTSKTSSKVTIAGDGTSEMHVYFWPVYNITFKAGDHGKLTNAGGDEVDTLGPHPQHYGELTWAASGWEKHPDAGYKFKQWDPVVADKVTGHATYVAQWEALDCKYTVEFYYQEDGAYPETATSSDERTGKTDASVEVTADDKKPTKDGYVLDESKSDAWTGTVAADESLVLKVYFKQQFTVTFDANGHGTAPDAQKVDAGKTATKPEDPSETGYEFGGWFTDKDCTTEYDFSTPVKSDMTLYAKWTEAETATITYDLNGGEFNGSTANILENYKVGEVISIHAAPTREGYVFSYWQGSAYQPGDSYTVVGDHTFKAVWVAIEEPEETDSDDDTDSDTEKSKGVKTGDEADLAGWLMLMLIAGAGTGYIALGRRRRED